MGISMRTYYVAGQELVKSHRGVVSHPSKAQAEEQQCRVASAVATQLDLKTFRRTSRMRMTQFAGVVGPCQITTGLWGCYGHSRKGDRGAM